MNSEHFKCLREQLSYFFFAGILDEQTNQASLLLVENAPTSSLKKIYIKPEYKDRYCLLKFDGMDKQKDKGLQSNEVGKQKGKQIEGLKLLRSDKLKESGFLKFCDYVLIAHNMIYFIEIKSSLNSNANNEYDPLENARIQFRSSKSLLIYIESLLFNHNKIYFNFPKDFRYIIFYNDTANLNQDKPNSLQKDKAIRNKHEDSKVGKSFALPQCHPVQNGKEYDLMAILNRNW